MAYDSKVNIFKNYTIPEIPGEYHRIICLTGKDKGTTYIINSKRVILGRGDTADIKIYDKKSSREHAELTKVGNKYFVTDLKSHNGIILNDTKIIQNELKENDRIIIGSTVYKYNLLNISEEEKTQNIEEILEKKPKRSKKKVRSGFTSQGPNKRIIIYGVVLVALFFILGDDNGQKKKKIKKNVKIKKESKMDRDFSTIDYKNMDDAVIKKIKTYIHRGRREMRELNYYRAIDQFELALILNPNNSEASFLLNKTKESLKSHVKNMQNKAKKNISSLKYKKALKQYCEIISILQNNPENEKYKDAELQIEELETKLGYKKGEFTCF